MTVRLNLPRWLISREIGLGDAISLGTAAIGLRPCGPCAERAARLNRLLVASPAADPIRARLAGAGMATDAAYPASAGAAGPANAADGPRVVHFPRDASTPAEDTDACCTYAVTLTNRHPSPPFWARWFPFLLWLWPQPYKVRVTAFGGTVILAADPGEWNETASSATGVTWDPGSGGPLPLGDPADSWIIDNDFLLSLGPPNTAAKMVAIEFLGHAGNVVDAFRVKIPCAMQSTDADFQTDYEQYTSVTHGGQYAFAYLEPDDCDPGDFDERSSCAIDTSTPACATSMTDGDMYSVTFTATPGYTSYDWSIDGGQQTQSGMPNECPVLLTSGSHDITVTIGSGINAMTCGTTLDITPPEPDFTWSFDACNRMLTLDGTETENVGDVKGWRWTCPSELTVNAQLSVFTGVAALADFTGVANGSYDITLETKDAWGCWRSKTDTVEISGCLAAFTASYSWCVPTIDPSIPADITVTFTPDVTACNPAYAWNFGDQNATPQNPNTSTAANPTHTYYGAMSGESHTVTLAVTPNNGTGCSTQPIVTLAQRKQPQGTVKVCADGQVICRTSESKPIWTATGSPHKRTWPYSKKNGSRVIYQYSSSGNYEITLTTQDANGNACTLKMPITVTIGCCTKRDHRSATSAPITVQIGSGTAELRVKARLSQRQGPFWHRVKAKSILQHRKSNGKWARFRSSAVRLEAAFTGTVYRSEWDPLAFDGSYFTGCTCELPASTSASSQHVKKRKVRAFDALGGPFQSRTGSLQSQHGVTVGGVTYTLATLSLARPC